MQQVLSGGSSDTVNNAATEFIHFWPTETDSWNATASTRRQVVPGNGRIKHLRVKLDVAPGAGTYTFTITKNAVATSLTVAITNPDTTGVDLVNEAVFAAGDRISFQCVPTGSPTNTPKATWCAIYEDTDLFEKCVLIGGIPNNMNTATSEFSSIAGGLNWGINVINNINSEMVSAVSGTYKEFYVLLNGAPGVGTSYTISPQISGGSGGLSVTISGTNTSGSDTALGGSILRGNSLNVLSNPAGVPAARQAFWGAGFLTNRPHEFMLMGQSNDFFAAGPEYNRLNATGHLWTTTEADRRCLVPACTIHGLIVKLGAEVTAGSITFTIFKNGSATGLTTTISSGSSGTDNTNYVECIDGDELSIEYNQTSLAAGVGATWAVICRKAFYSLPITEAGI